MNFLQRLFSDDGFMPHGHCYFWDPSVLRLHIISDALITAAYLTIPVTLIYIMRKRKDLPFDWMFACFGTFILACGATHAMEIWNIWHPTYWLAGCLKALTAAASLATAALLMKLVPKILAIPNPKIMGEANRALEKEIAERKNAEEAQQNLAIELARERQRLEGIVNSVPAIVVEHWVEGAPNRNFASDYVGKLLGYTPEEWHATPDFWQSRVHPDDRERARANMAEMFAGRSPGVDDECRWLARDGRLVWGETHLVAIRDEDGRTVGFRGMTIDVTARKQAEMELDRMNKELMFVSRRAGMSEVASSVLHNVGNILNSVNISLSVATDKAGQMKIASVGRIATLLREHAEDLPAFFANHPQGRQLPAFLGQVADHLTTGQQMLLGELESLQTHFAHINEIVAMQQSLAGTGGLIEPLSLADVIDDALRMNAAALSRHGSRVVRELDPASQPVEADRHKILLILTNLIRNAKYACDDAGHDDKRITVRTEFRGDGLAGIAVSDNGIGIPPENLARIFEHGFTTRKDGHGFGLHSSALAAADMGGSLRVQSDGHGQGATFTLEIPLTASETPPLRQSP